MALTQVLVERVPSLGPSVWWHATNTPTLLVGPSLMRVVSRDVAPVAIPIVGRPTGGGAILAGPGVLALDVALPATHSLLSGDVVEDYAWFGNVWAAALRSIGVDARVLSVAEARRLSSQLSPRTAPPALACFGSYSPYEVTAGGRKLVGLSQVRRSGGVVFSAAIHLDVNPAGLAAALPLSATARRALAVHLTRYAVRLDEVAPWPVGPRDLMAAVRRALRGAHGVSLQPSCWTAAEIAQAEAASARL